MKSIQVLVDKLPVNGYHDICKYYNENRSDGSQSICRAGVCEGGFEISLSKDELKSKTQYRLDPNDMVRQLRWSNGWLLNMGYMGLTEEQTKLLFEALKSVLGSVNVVYKEYVDNSKWWNKSNASK